jgi:hypothetical protein
VGQYARGTVSRIPSWLLYIGAGVAALAAFVVIVVGVYSEDTLGVRPEIAGLSAFALLGGLFNALAVVLWLRAREDRRSN